MKDDEKTREQLTEELQSLRLRLGVLEKASFPGGKNTEEIGARDLHKPARRVEGLDCLQAISRLVATPGVSLERILRGTVEILSRAWQDPYPACARIILGNKIYGTANFQESVWRTESSFRVHGEPNGILEVFYLKEPPHDGQEPFLPEEIKVIDIVSERLGRIIDRKRVEESLRFSNTILSTQQEMAPDGILVRNQSGEIISWNKMFIDLWGIPADVLETRSDELALQTALGKLVDPDSFLAVVSRLNDDISATDNGELSLTDGRVFIYHSAPMIGGDGVYYGRVWYFRDITERKAAEDALRESETRYRTLFVSAPSGLFRLDLDGRILDANPALVRILGYPNLEDVKELNYFTLCHDPMDSQRLQNLLETRGVVHRMELRMTHPQKETIWGRKTIWRVFDSSVNIVGYDGIVDDVSEYKNIAQLLHATSDRFDNLM